MDRRGISIGATAAVVAALVAVGTADRTAAAGPPDRAFCSLTGMTTFLWDGGGDGTSWSDADNWADGAVPGTADPAGAYVCIPGGSTVDMAAGDIATVQAVDTEITSRLDIAADAGLFVYGDPATRASVVAGDISADGALGGPGVIHDLAETELPFFAGSVRADLLVSDPCTAFPELPPHLCTSTEGTLISYGGGGVGALRLVAGYDLLLQGGSADLGPGGLGMSPGSRLVIGHEAGVAIFGDGDIYALAPGPTRPVVVNRGSIDHYPSVPMFTDETTTIGTAYQGRGTVQVWFGTRLIIADGSTRPVALTARSRFGSGPCRRVADHCTFTTLAGPGKRQSATFQAPSSQPESQEALSRVRPRPDLRRPGDLGSPYVVHAAELSATAATPAIIELRYDGSLLHGRTWRRVEIFRQHAPGGPWQRIRSCRADGTPRGSASACVDRRRLEISSRQVPGSGGDAILVVRTTVTSRWVGHRR